VVIVHLNKITQPLCQVNTKTGIPSIYKVSFGLQ